MSQPTRAVITLATTKPVFVGMAFALARSFFYWNRDPGLKFHLVTDLAVELPADLAAMELIRVEPGKLGLGFSPKLHLDSLVPPTARCSSIPTASASARSTMSSSASRAGRWASSAAP